MHDISVIRQQHLALAAREQADELFRFAERCAASLDETSPLGTDARALVAKAYDKVRARADAPVATGPHTYIPLSARKEDGLVPASADLTL
jgi:hypothetical protein